MDIDEGQVVDLIAMREAAEKVVEGMPDGPMKVKAFEMAFQSLQTGGPKPVASKRSRRSKAARPKAGEQPEEKKPRKSSGPKGLITELVAEGFFSEWRTLPDIQKQLVVRGHIYKQEQLSPRLLELTKAKVLRRERKPEGKKEIWAYRKFKV